MSGLNNCKSIDNMHNILLYIICIELILFSGGVVFFLQNPYGCIVIWFFTCVFYWNNYRKKQNLILKKNLQIAIFWIFWVLLTTFVVNRSPQDWVFIGVCIFPLGSAFLNSTVNFYAFRACLLRCSQWIFGISIIVHLLHVLRIIGAVIIMNKYAISWFFFNTQWGAITTSFGQIYRFSGVFWEPGQAQIVIAYILVLFTDDITANFKNIVYIIKRYGILIFAMFLTGSTTGYLVIALLGASIILFSYKRKKNVILLSLLLVCSSIFVYSVLNSSIVQDKFAQREDTSERTSYSIRMNDNIACLRAAVENPVFGLGSNTKKMLKTIESYGSVTSSNGWLRACACFGIFVILGYFILMWKNLKYMKLRMPRLIIILTLILSQCNEYYIFFPYMYIYIMRFRYYIPYKQEQSVILHN